MNLSFKGTTPRKVNKNILKIIELLGLNREDLFNVDYTNETAFKTEENNCHLNNLVKVKLSGGSIVFGWVFWEDYKRGFIEASFHSMWKNFDGKLIDITPRVDKETKILFIRDGNRKIELFRHNGNPAIRTFDNLRMIMGLVITEPKRKIGLIQSELIDNYLLI